MYKNIKLQLNPSTSDISVLESQAKICNSLYNTLLEKCIKQFIFFKNKQPQDFNPHSAYDIRNQIPKLKKHKDYKYLNALYSSVSKNVRVISW